MGCKESPSETQHRVPARVTETRIHHGGTANRLDGIFHARAGRLLELVDAGEDGLGRRRIIRNTSLPDCVDLESWRKRV